MLCAPGLRGTLAVVMVLSLSHTAVSVHVMFLMLQCAAKAGLMDSKRASGSMAFIWKHSSVLEPYETVIFDVHSL